MTSLPRGQVGCLELSQYCHSALGASVGSKQMYPHTLRGILELADVVRGDRPAQGWKDLVPDSLETEKADSITALSYHQTVRGTVGAVRCGHHVCCALMLFFHLCRSGRKEGICHSRRAGSA